MIIRISSNQKMKKTRGYSIRSPPMGENGGFLKSWVIEGSIDNQNWEVIDEQINSEFWIGK